MKYPRPYTIRLLEYPTGRPRHTCRFCGNPVVGGMSVMYLKETRYICQPCLTLRGWNWHAIISVFYAPLPVMGFATEAADPEVT